MSGLAGWFWAIVGSTMVGAHFGSWVLAIGVYACIVAVGNWEA